MEISIRKELPRLPLDGNLDLTYRCNNTCRHCWLWLPPGAKEQREELILDELKRVVDEARSMGCHSWGISGGEPMLRQDFSEIFDYITRKAVIYRLNTNGTMITPAIAQLMRRKGRKMVALYGATAEVHDNVTRNPGSFEAMLRGITYLKEAGAGFEVQIIPMRSNYHQYQDMLVLAESLSPHYRVGAAWLYMSASGASARNREIASQRLNPDDVLVVDQPSPTSDAVEIIKEHTAQPERTCRVAAQIDDRLYAACIDKRRDFHVDPYGKMSFCYYVKDPTLRFDLRQASFREVWEEFIPGLADKVHGGQEYIENCGVCDLRDDCRWCGVYGYLEHHRNSAKVEYLCQVAAQTRQYKENWKMEHLRYYEIAGITLQLATDFPIQDTTFDPKFDAFRVEGPGLDNISLQLRSPIPELSDVRLTNELYRKPPWAVYRQSHAWAYLGIPPDGTNNNPDVLAIFEEDHSKGTIYHRPGFYEKGNFGALTTLPTDQVFLGRVLADRQGCYLHSSGFMINGRGLLFIGHSGAGKSTTLKMLRGSGEILCDDRNIVRHWPDGFRLHGTWSHGELPEVSPASAPLHAILLLEQSLTNELIPITDQKERFSVVLSHLVKPFVDTGWWDKILPLASQIAREVPAYRMRFDKSGRIRDLLCELVNSQ